MLLAICPTIKSSCERLRIEDKPRNDVEIAASSDASTDFGIKEF
jgi:hypothetical protein